MSQSQARERLRESLSAAIDGEATELELRRVLNALAKDDALRAEWDRAHLVGAALRGHVAPPADAARPWLEAAAPTAVGRRAPRWERWAWPAAGAAAAVFAALAVVLTLAPNDVAAPTPAVAVEAGVASAPKVAAVVGGHDPAARGLAQTPTNADLRRASRYMLRHAHQSSISRTGVPHLPVGTAPFAKVLAAHDGTPTTTLASTRTAEPRPAR